MKNKLYYFGSIGFVSLLVFLFIFIKTMFNPGWERQAGLVDGYESEQKNNDLRAWFTLDTKIGLVSLKFFSNKSYEMIVDAGGANLLYSKGTFIVDKIDEFGTSKSSYTGRIIYKLISDEIDKEYAIYRAKKINWTGQFGDKSKIKWTKDPALIKGFETCQEHFVFYTYDGYVMDLSNTKKFGLFKKYGEGLKYEYKRKIGTLPVSPQQDSAGLVSVVLEKAFDIASVYQCDTCFQDTIIRLVLQRGNRFEIHLIINEKEFIYQKGNLDGFGWVSLLNGGELTKSQAQFRLLHYPHGWIHCGEDDYQTLEDLENAACFVEDWEIYRHGTGFYDKRNKIMYTFQPELSNVNLAIEK